MKTVLLLASCVLGLAAPGFSSGRPITVSDLLAMERISDQQVSPNGSGALYTVAVPDLTANRTTRNVWLVSLRNGDAKALTTSGRDSGARRPPDDGRRVAMVSQRDGGAQLWRLDFERPGDATRLTALSGGVDNSVWSPDGRPIAFTSEVSPDCKDEACNAARCNGRRNPRD